MILKDANELLRRLAYYKPPYSRTLLHQIINNAPTIYVPDYIIKEGKQEDSDA